MIGVSITKSVAWRGVTERFSNVYHYDTAGDASLGELRALVADVVSLERNVHASTVTFVEARVWSAGGTPQENETRLIDDLAGTGNAAPASTMDREQVYLVQFRTSRPSVTGRPVTLKKFIHACSLLGAPDVGQLAGVAQIPGEARTALLNYAEGVRLINNGSISGNLVASSSSGRVAGDPFVFDWIEHHEFRY